MSSKEVNEKSQATKKMVPNRKEKIGTGVYILTQERKFLAM
jgi:hypothetical protein